LSSLFGCSPSQEFDAISNTCEKNIMANATFAQVKELYQGELLQIQEDLIIEGYITSSDKEGNFFSVLHFQDKASNPTEGFQIGIDLFESHLLFEPGQKIMIKLKGLYLGKSRGVFKLGGTFSGFGNTTVGRLPALKIPEHIFRSCESTALLEPKTATIFTVNSTMTNTLVQLKNVQFSGDDLGLSYAEPNKETERTIEDCKGHQIALLNSGFANFQNDSIPEGNGNLSAVVLQKNDDFYLAIRDVDDIDFSEERCADVKQTATQVFFSELADPNNNKEARFIELYNASTEAINLAGWTINRYTNEHTTVSSKINLDGFIIAAQNTFVISPNAAEFEKIYGFPPDVNSGSNSPADSNGDDNLELVDPFGMVIDTFGLPGEDGTGTNHEFEDGKALRKPTIFQANPKYTFSEWLVYNDSGDAETINQIQNAPEDFSPGIGY